MNFQRRLIQIFCAFVEKSLLPQIKQHNGSLIEWIKFSALLSRPQINYTELQTYVSTLSSTVKPLLPDKQLNLKAKQNKDHVFQFHPHRTFGGERNKHFMTIFEDSSKRKQNQPAQSPPPNINIAATFPRLKKLLEVVEQNQKIIEKFNDTQRIQRSSQKSSRGYIQENMRQTMPANISNFHNFIPFKNLH